MTEREKFTKWFNEQKEDGMVDLKYFNGDTHDCSTEEYFAELNAMNEAQTTTVVDCSENFERYLLDSGIDVERLADDTIRVAGGSWRDGKLVFNDAITKK